ncbi:MAG TPA: polysaccharide deacetylase family protein [Syntrophomonas sp.]|nr:polysaccharide deacetylase family protein [Syntrophomonas sp.]
MKIYYFPKKNIVIIAIALVLALGMMGWGMLAQQSAMTTSDLREPIFQGNSGAKAVAITVNVDWGEEYIPEMLKQFKAADAKVTFFVTGRWAEKNPDLLKQMAKEGHSIQNHGYRHLHFNSLSAEQGSAEIKKAEEIIKGITGTKTRYFASPYGEFSSNVVAAAANIDYKLIMWSVDTVDWKRPLPETIVSRVMKKVHNDAIILMHPTEPTVKALPEMLKQLQAEKYKMLTIDKVVLDQSPNPDRGEKTDENK